jgi:serine/threonine protein kinase/predicted Zn-dependent protease
MNLSASRRTWEEASSPAAVRLARKYEQEWRDSELLGRKPDLRAFLNHAGAAADGPGARLAILRADMSLRWDAGDKVDARWYLDRYRDLSEDTIVALIYEEFCLREEDQEKPDPAEFLGRYPHVAVALGRVLEIHALVGSGTAPTTLSFSSSINGTASADRAFPEAGQTIADFVLVEELGRGAFARVFLAKEVELADRPVALKVSRRGSREPQTLARLQHTHIVPVHSHRIDAVSGLHLLCMPYFGRITLSRVLADPEVQNAASGTVLAEALDRLDAAGDLPAGRSAGRRELARRSYSRAIAWWCARLAEALAHAHDRGVLHRDIKPSNVLVTSDGMPMLLDFNLAREPLPEDGRAADTATLGGTIDYMAPEHLKALSEPSAHEVDGRADIYGLGVMLYEAVTGQRPFRSPRRGTSVVDALLRAIDDRLQPLPRLREQHPEIPPALEAVIRRCLEPEPTNRYQTAAFLAADLQAVADDLPLKHTREPWTSRAVGWVRRRRRLLAMAAVILLASTTCLAALLSVLNQRTKDFEVVQRAYQRGVEAYDNGDYRTSKLHFDAAADLADRYSQNSWGALTKLNNFRELGTILSDKFKKIESPRNLDEIKARALAKSQLADRIDKTRSDADALFEAADGADGLLFRLHLGEGRELVRTFEDLQKALAPFYVLKSEDWTKLGHTLPLLDHDRRERLLIVVNELLFLWMAQIDERLETSPDSHNEKAVLSDHEAVESGLKICQKALVWVEPKEPWLAMVARFKTQKARRAQTQGPAGIPRADPAAAEPLTVALESSPLACFQWGLLALRDERLPRAVEWLRRSAQLQSNNHWYQYFLAYLEDKAGSVDEALKDYSVAIANRPESPWVRFSRARLYRSKGRWDMALEDMKVAFAILAGRSEAAKVQLELGYLYYELGDFARARAEYDQVIRANPDGPYGPAARLNRANMDAESGSLEPALREYDALLAENYLDNSARFSRAVLELRQGHAERALVDCTTLLDMKQQLENPAEVLTTRALALLLLGRPDGAIVDATLAQRIQPSPTHERLRQRTILAARRFNVLQLDWPDELALLPLGGRRLDADLRAATDGLDRLARASRDETFRASLTLAVILAAQRHHQAAIAAANRALQVSPSSPRGYLIRARVRNFGGDHSGAQDDIERGLAIQVNEPGLLELKGVLRAGSGDHRAALEDFNSALVWGAVDRIHLNKAASLVALGNDLAAVQEWSLALRRDPELPEAYLGRARSHLRLRHWDMALADLEQAASWAHSDPRVEVGIVVSYFQCLGQRPGRLSRCAALTLRAASDLWGALAAPPVRARHPI